MNVSTVIKKNISSNKNGFIMSDYKDSNSVSFFAVLPKSAVVDRVKVNGEFLEDITAKNIRHHRGIVEKLADDEYRCVATVWFEEDDLELYDKLANHDVQDFEVYYHLEAVVETD